MCGGLDAMQTDYYSLYERYFAPRGIAMLTIDMPSVGFSSKWKLAYEEAAQRLPGTMRQMEFTVPGGAPITGFLHMPKGDGPFPTVLMCGGLDAMQTDYYSLYERYFALRGIAMLTIDMPSVGFSSKWKLTQDSSLLHQHVLKALQPVASARLKGAA